MTVSHHIHNKKIGFTLFFCFILCVGLFGQNYDKQYTLAKKLFAEKKYTLAIKAFEPLIVYSDNNPYFRYASFYYAISMYEEGRLVSAKKMLIQLRKLYPTWEQHSELNYWLAKIYFEQRQYFQAMNMLKGCVGKAMQNSIKLIKNHYLKAIKDIETLRMLLEEYPNDSVVAQLLVDAISLGDSPTAYGQLRDSLYKRFDFDRDTSIFFVPDHTVFKDRYTVSLLFPFMVEQLYPTLKPKINQTILDLYKGMTMALDTLEEQQIHIDLKLYDTQRNLERTEEILNDEGVAQSDLLVGPLFSNQIPLVEKFSREHQINMINPVSGNSLFLNNNPYSILYMPEHKTVGIRSAEWLDAHVSNKKCMVFFDGKPKNRSVIKGFLERAEQLGLHIVEQKYVSAQDADEIFYELASPSSLVNSASLKDTTPHKEIGSVFVASDDPMIYTKVISGVATRVGDPIIVLGNQSWVNSQVVSFQTYERLNIVLAAPGFYSLYSPHYKKFKKKYITKYAEPPSQYARVGYEFMLFVGHCLDRYGVYFQRELGSQEFIKGDLSEGYSFEHARSNQFLPFIHFINGELTVFRLKTSD